MKVIVYTRPDGGVSVVMPCVSKDDPEGFTQDQALERAIKKDVPADAIKPCVVDTSTLPQDQTFRNAWIHDGNGNVSHDMSKSRELWKNRMRWVRKSALAALDTEYMRADESGDVIKKQAIAKQKQDLRDVTNYPGIDAAQTPEDLKAVWPDILPKV